MNSTDFLGALASEVAGLRATVRTQLAPLAETHLRQHPAPGRWNALECLEHLNGYSRYYLPALAQGLARPGATPVAEVGYSWLGRKSVAMMRPDSPRKQATPARMNPLHRALDCGGILAEFDQHAANLLALLAQARTANLNRTAIPVEFFRLLRLRLGETLEFVVVHQQRHVQQALRGVGQ